MDQINIEKCIKGKKILITGGTGSLGNDLIEHIAKYDPKKIIIYSRDENKQYHMQNKYKYPFLEFELGDIRDLSRLTEATRDIDIIIHAAALKHVPPAEKNPMEFVKTNVLGARNVVKAALVNKVSIVIEIGTDKSVKPINTYGITKALQEKIIISANNNQQVTKFMGVRYGNVIGSRGSVIPFFIEKAKMGEVLPITIPTMTRFLLSLNDAIDLIFYAISEGRGGEIFVKKIPAANIVDIAKSVGEAISGNKDYPIEIVGIRPGEKIHELLVSEEEMGRVIELEDKYIIYEHGKNKESKIINKNIFEYGSNNTNQLNRQQIIEMLKSTGWVK